ncbi:MAG TPA: FkbM family methyltransferase [Candidatus Thermoplasmatota archaeon]|nr:FkbM family methyltransferase [Candidatus Thermoplasmatota archaeon]
MATAKPDREMRAYMAITRRLPRAKGVGAFANVLKRIYARKPRAPVELEAHGARMLLDPNEFLDREVIFTPQLYDRRMLDHLRRHLKPGDTFLDAGANIGVFSLVASQCVGPTGRVLSVDADPRIFRILSQNLALNDARNVTAVNLGLGEEKGTLRFAYGTEGLRGVGSFLTDGRPGDIDVEVRTLAEVASSHGFSGFTGAKFDIEGFEHRVLKRYLADAPRERWPRFMVVERLPHFVEKAGGDVIALLQEHGYRIVWHEGADHIVVRD